MHKKSALMLFLAAGALALDFTLGLQPTAAQATLYTGSWRSYGNTNPITSSKSSWKCGRTTSVGANFYAQSCTVRSADRLSIQGAIIVRNRTSSLRSASAVLSIFRRDAAYLGSWYCKSSGVGGNSWSVCFGNTFRHPSSVETSGFVNSSELYSSGFH